MINWIKNKIYAEKDAEIAQLLRDNNDAYSKSYYYRNQMKKAQGMVKRIEREKMPEDVSSLLNLRMILAEQDVPSIDIHFAAMPISFGPLPTNESFRKREIILNTSHGMIVHLDDNEDFMKDLAHSTSVDLARDIGRAVTEKLMFEAGWRLPR